MNDLTCFKCKREHNVHAEPRVVVRVCGKWNICTTCDNKFKMKRVAAKPIFGVFTINSRF